MTNTSPGTLVIERDPRKIVAGRYVVDPIHTRVRFSVVHFGVSNYWGEFYGPIGRLEIDPASPDKTSIDVSVSTAQIKTNSMLLDAELKSADWFDVARFSRISLVGKGITLQGASSATLTGDFTLHGFTRPVEFSIEFTGAGISPFTGSPVIGFEAKAIISRREFGICAKYPIVGDLVTLMISAAFDYA